MCCRGAQEEAVPVHFRAISEMEFPDADRASRKERSGISLDSGEDTAGQHVPDRAIVPSATGDWKAEILFPKPNQTRKFLANVPSLSGGEVAIRGTVSLMSQACGPGLGQRNLSRGPASLEASRGVTEGGTAQP